MSAARYHWLRLIVILIALWCYVLFPRPGSAFDGPGGVQTRRILILGASISWGCVSHCGPQTERSYVERLRQQLPHSEIRAAAWFGAGVLDWDPLSPPIVANGLSFPIGVWEEGEGDYSNLWSLLGRPALLAFRPHFVVVMAGLGDALRPLRIPPRAAPSPREYARALSRLARAIRRLGALPVLTVDSPFGPKTNAVAQALTEDYRDAVGDVCRRFACGPDLMAVVPVEAFEGTDQVHPNALGHAAIARAFTSWFDDPRPCRHSTCMKRISKPPF